tara:strand:+ start:40 stop:411 length:372 start_codon:yes stop_codon:yes gene_type:complete
MEALIILVTVYVIFDELQQHCEKNGWKLRLNPKGDNYGVWNTKVRPWLNNETSWKNKHNMRPSWLFKTALVGFTDGEHLFQLLKHLTIAGLAWHFTGSFLLGVLTQAVISGTSFIMNGFFLRR